jgi:hypothetical protein
VFAAPPMTRSLDDVRRALELFDLGYSKKEIARRLGASRSTVRSWIGDRAWALSRPQMSGILRDCDGSCKPWADLMAEPYSYLLGMYLGDGCISKMRRTYRLRIFCCDAYPKIMDEVTAAICALLNVKVGRVPRVGCTELGAYSRHWPCFFPQHGEGMKHLRPIVLATWQTAIVEAQPRPFIRGLIQSDGWRGENVAIRHTELAVLRRTYTRYLFTNKSDDIRGLFCWALDLLDVHWTQSNQWTISVSRRKDVGFLDSFVGPKR